MIGKSTTIQLAVYNGSLHVKAPNTFIQIELLYRMGKRPVQSAAVRIGAAAAPSRDGELMNGGRLAKKMMRRP